MLKHPSTADAHSWHRYFASESNNKAWDLATKERTEAEDHEMLAAAHASLFHWSVIGTELNHMRAKMIVAEVHALLGMGHTSYMYAKEMYDYYTNRETLDWELALTYAVFAHAAHVSGDYELHGKACQDALDALDVIDDQSDRDVVIRTFSLVPAPAE